MKRLSLTFLGVVLFLLPCRSQTASTNPYGFGIALGRQKTGLPFYEMLSFPPHSSFSVEISRNYGKLNPGPWYQSLTLHLYQNNSTGSGYFVQTQSGREFQFAKSLVFCPEAGVGISHRFHPRGVYTFTEEGYERFSDWGKLSPVVQLRLLLGYQTQLVLLYASYQLNGEFFYNEDSPVFPSTFLQFGARYHLKKPIK